VFDWNVKEFPKSHESDAALMRISGYTNREKWGRAKEGAKSSLEKFSRYWKLLLIAWLCLYLFLSLSAYSEEHGHLSETGVWALGITITIFNNFNSWAIALCFIVFNHPTVFRAKEKEKETGRGRPDEGDDAAVHDAESEQETSLARLTRRTKVWGPVAILAFAAIECLLIFPGVKPASPPWTPRDVLWCADFVSGIVGAITLALFVGRIQSKFLGPSTWLPSAFFFYVAIQSLYVAIGAGENWAPTMIESALILKCLMYLYVAWLFKSGRLLYYLVRVKTVYVRVNIEWEEFLANLHGQR
jgi:hypothetical protein